MSLRAVAPASLHEIERMAALATPQIEEIKPQQITPERGLIRCGPVLNPKLDHFGHDVPRCRNSASAQQQSLLHQPTPPSPPNDMSYGC